eukprot:CAMPEP_0201931192 /NCGR_PEP_ID=MMETSP0903-20130614/26836_1 /ASSEMBLY_ACC=CAM_ASM_000552 /TAXON_ID=420261 /ORGANISM="Thalassiosira antarctica, Strain CCMP982" /LENGTH=62 /DNA_ID=CAMNT_0048470455 /DNA_START=393 /DNA_END=578 /DNA_ORIENTATION=-
MAVRYCYFLSQWMIVVLIRRRWEAAATFWSIAATLGKDEEAAAATAVRATGRGEVGSAGRQR